MDALFSSQYSKSLLNRRYRFNHPKLRSMTHRRGKGVNPRCPRGRRTTSTWTPISRPTSSTSPAYALSTQTFLSVGIRCFTSSNKSAPISRSVASAPATHISNGHPRVSTTRWRLRPLILFPPVPASFTAGLGAFHRLAIHDARGGIRVSSFTSTDFTPQQRHYLVPRPILRPLVVVVIHRLPDGKVMGQHPPLTSCAYHVKDRIHHLPGVYPARTSWFSFGLLHQRCYPCPLLIRQIRRIRASPSHHPSPFGHAQGVSIFPHTHDHAMGMMLPFRNVKSQGAKRIGRIPLHRGAPNTTVA